MEINNIVLYHSHCTDGFGAALAAHFYFHGAVKLIPVSYGKEYPELIEEVRGKNVYIFDFSFNRNFTRQLIDVASNFIWRDHHKTAFEEWCPEYTESEYTCTEVDSECNPVVVDILLDLNKSGAVLAWEYFFEEIPPRFIHFLDDYDRWLFKDSRTKPFMRNLRSHEMNITVWADLFDRLASTEKLAEFVDAGIAIERFYMQQVRGMCDATKRKLTLTYDGNSFDILCCNTVPCFTSDIGHLLAVETGTFGLCWYETKNGDIACSLRSTNGFDVSAIARAFGGGGHKSAAGFSVSRELLSSWISQANPSEVKDETITV